MRVNSEIELPLLASEAAIEFDCAIRGNSIGFEAAKSLGLFIQNDAVNDFIAGNLIYQALANSHSASVTNVHSAVEASEDLAIALANADQGTSADWPSLRDFCVAFSDKLVKHRQFIRSSLPSNPNRR